ncbi:hypothetical protein [Shinella pollutisoli]|uniref:DUF1344 domain-containing protein n=1 Tax=Shinella pollutisoli TaxID=2250594 RepID=A0ABV7DIS8_9HYPH|nr:hypothetical protein [Shinella pollutisoli]
MKKIVLSAAFALFAGSALAAMPVSGIVQSYDAHTRVITFESGKTVALPQDVAVPANLAAGTHASVVFDDDGDRANIVLTR